MPFSPKPIRYRVFNRLVNPLVVRILDSPWHRLLSGALLTIHYRGRKSGIEYTIPVQFVRTGPHIYVIPADHEKKSWWRNFRTAAPVQLRIQGKSVGATAEILDSVSNPDVVLEAFAAYFDRFLSAARFHRIARTADGRYDGADLKRIASQIPMIRILPDSPSLK